MKRSHSSRPRNPLIADVCFKGRLIDTWERGTLRIIYACKEAGLPEPELIEQDGGFLVTLFKNNLTEEQLAKLGLNPRQIKAVQYVKEKGKITNKEYQEMNSIGKSVTIDELRDLVERQIFVRIGETGRGTYYELP